MPNCVHSCEVCRHRASFYIDTDMLVEAQEGTSVSRHCPVCRKTTNWTFVCLDRRSGRKRRQDSDRRTHTSEGFSNRFVQKLVDKLPSESTNTKSGKDI